MAETIKVLVSEEEVNERIKTLGKQISENYAGKQIHMICVLKSGGIVNVRVRNKSTRF